MDPLITEALDKLHQDWLYEPYEEALPRLLAACANSDERVYVYFEVHSALLRMGKRERARQVLQEAGGLLEDCQSPESWVLLDLARSEPGFVYGEQPDLARECLLKLKSTIASCADEIRFRWHRAMSWVYIDSGQHEQALSESKDALRLARSVEHQQYAQNQLGLVFFYMDQLDDAEAHLSRALGYARIGNYKKETAGSLCDLGNVAFERGDLAGARQLRLEALNLIEQTSDARFHATILANTALNLIEQEEYSLAEEYLQRSLQIAKCSGNLATQTLALNLQGRIFLALRKPDRALEVLQQAHEHLESVPNWNRIAILEKLITASAGVGDFNQERQYWKELKELHVRDLQARVNAMTRHIREIETQQREQERRLLELELYNREQALSVTTSSYAAQTELLANFREELRRIVQVIDEPLAALKRVKDKLKELPCEQIDWLKFEEQFHQVHPEFKPALLAKYPELTKQEARICQLLRVGMKSHEIARLICISERGVENHRFNIRKKLGLKTEQSITEFLQGIKQ